MREQNVSKEGVTKREQDKEQKLAIWLEIVLKLYAPKNVFASFPVIHEIIISLCSKEYMCYCVVLDLIYETFRRLGTNLNSVTE